MGQYLTFAKNIGEGFNMTILQYLTQLKRIYEKCEKWALTKTRAITRRFTVAYFPVFLQQLAIFK